PRQGTATRSRSTRFEVRPMNREERDGVQDEEGESRGDARWRQLNREHQHDRSESNDGREGNGPRPQLASQDSDSRPERNDGGVPAQERVSGTQRIETGPHDPEQHRNDPTRGRYDGRSWTAFRGGRDHREARGDEAGERDDPDRPAEGPELNRTRQEEEPTDQKAQPDEPAYHLVRARTHGSVICAERISVEPRWTDELSRKVSCAPRRCARVGAGRSAEDRLLCKQEVLGSNPSRSTPVPYLPRFKSTFRTVPDLGLESSVWPCASRGTGLPSGTEWVQGERGPTTSSKPKGASSAAQPSQTQEPKGRVRIPR